MLVVTRYQVPLQDAAEFEGLLGTALDVLVDRPGCRGAWIGRATDDPTLWTLTTLWDGAGAYRRALSSTPVKTHAVPVMYRAVDEPSAYDELVTWTPSAGRSTHEPATSIDG